MIEKISGTDNHLLEVWERDVVVDCVCASVARRLCPPSSSSESRGFALSAPAALDRTPSSDLGWTGVVSRPDHIGGGSGSSRRGSRHGAAAWRGFAFAFVRRENPAFGRG